MISIFLVSLDCINTIQAVSTAVYINNDPKEMTSLFRIVQYDPEVNGIIHKNNLLP